MKASTILSWAILFGFVAISVQQGEIGNGRTVEFDLVSGTVVAWPVLSFNNSMDPIPFPSITIWYNSTLYANTTYNVITEFYDVNTSEVLYSTTPIKTQNNGPPESSAQEFSATAVSPCETMKWNIGNRMIGARNIIDSTTNSKHTSSSLQNIAIFSTGMNLNETQGYLSHTGTKYFTLQTPASGKQNYKVSIDLQTDESPSLPFVGYCLSQNGSCGTCIAKGNIPYGTTEQKISVHLPPSGFFFLALTDNTTTPDVLFSISTTVTSNAVHAYVPIWITAAVVLGMLMV
eukprot:Phypoly_transcript_11778.p1 GENE.Phypoly_transcript_11778~~Phypoly_transcript_11778.p1  ORF type:complete len:289 (+),score=40.25 Phypoly_transcript_11778:284-1150(+)